MTHPVRWSWIRTLSLFVVAVCAISLSSAHLNAPHIYVEEELGGYPLIIVVEMPPAVPGEAELQVLFQQLDEGDRPKLELLEIPPQGESAAAEWQPLKVSEVDDQYFTARISLTVTGMWRARLRLDGNKGQGEVEIPIGARIPIPRVMEEGRQWILGGLGIFLAISLFYIGLGLGRDAVRPQGAPVTKANRRWGMAMGLLCVTGLGLFLWFIANFWRDYHAWHHVQAEPGISARLKVTGEEAAAGVPAEVTVTLSGPRNTIVPDLVKQRGKWLHIGVVEVPTGEYFMAAHPRRINKQDYRFAFTPPRPGVYKVFIDVLRASGESETFADVINVGPGIDPIDFPFEDADDAHAFPAPIGQLTSNRFEFEDGYVMQGSFPETMQKLRPVRIEFELLDPSGQRVELQPYLGESGRMMVMSDDNAVFMHIHESGSIGVRNEDEDAAPPEFDGLREVTFPFGFPTEGAYRLFVQMRDGDQIRTGTFDVQATP